MEGLSQYSPEYAERIRKGELKPTCETISIAETRPNLQGKSSYAQAWRDGEGNYVAHPGSVEYIPSSDFLVEEKKAAVQAAKPPASNGFITIRVNEDKAKTAHFHDITKDNCFYALMVVGEGKQVDAFLKYQAELGDKWVLVGNLLDGSLAKLVKSSNASRYFPGGRMRIKAKIHKHLGRWYNCPGLLLSLTFAPELISRSDAWRLVRENAREFMNRVNRWRKRAGYSKAKFLTCLEVQPGTGYPHLHLVFPYLKWLAPAEFMISTWGQGSTAVDWKVKDSLSPVSYICKYVTKMDAWPELALSYIWKNRTRLYSMSRDYRLTDYADKRVPEWQFKRCLTGSQAINLVACDLGGYETLLGADVLVIKILGGGNL